MAGIDEIIRVGFVRSRDEKTMRVRVEITDTVTSPLVTDWLPVLVPRAKKDRCYDLPDIDDQVLCLFLPFAKESGFVLGSMYGADSPPVSSGDKDHRTYEDGTVIEYDRKKHVLKADVKGRVVVDAEQDITATSKTKVDVYADISISMTAPDIYQNGNVIAGGMSEGSTAEVTERANRKLIGSFEVNGKVKLNNDVEIGGNLSIGGDSSVGGNSYAASRTGGKIGG